MKYRYSRMAKIDYHKIQELNITEFCKLFCISVNSLICACVYTIFGMWKQYFLYVLAILSVCVSYIFGMC